MKNTKVATRVAFTFSALTGNLVASTIAVGEGSDSSFLILESPNIGLRTYEVFYDFDTASPLGTDDLLTIIDGADALISFSFGGAPENQFLTGITFDGIGEFSDFSGPVGIFWSQWVAGGQAGFDDVTFVADPQPVPGDSWSFGAGISEPYRLVEPGASDALVYGASAAPSVAPIPEPSSGFLFVSSALLLATRRHRSQK